MALKIILNYLDGQLCGFDDEFIKETAAEVSYTKEEVDALLTRVLDLKGIVDAVSDLPESGNKIGDFYLVREDEAEYVWVPGNSWEKLGPIKELFYDAAKVKFTRSFSLAGDYTSVGNIKINDVFLASEGKTLEQVMEMIFDKKVQPTLGAAPTNSITLTGAGAYEVGTEFTPAYSITFNQGKYNQPWNNSTVLDGTSDASWNVTATDGQHATTKTGTLEPITVTDDMSFKLSAVTSYTAGAVAKDNKNEDSDPVVQRAAGNTASANSAAVTAFRYAYIGSIVEDVEVDETVIKSLTRFKVGAVSKTIKASGGDIALVPGAVKIIVAVPTGTSKTSCGGYNLSEVLLVSASNTPITSDYHQLSDDVEVSGAVAGSNKKAYKVYVYQPAIIDPGEVHSIKLA